MKTMRTIIFAGHFDIFERLKEVQQKTITDALNLEGDHAILVGDIGVAGKLAFFIKEGNSGIKDVYRFRREDCRSMCVLSQLPKEKDLDKIIDLDQYEQAIAILRKESKSIFESLKNDFLYDLSCNLRDEYAKIVREKIVPFLVRNRLKEYDLERDQIKLLSERQLRNKVSKRTRKQTKRNLIELSWRQVDNLRELGKQFLLGPMELVNERGNPLCRGIILSLYETIVSQGYNKVIQLYSKEHHSSLTKAQFLFERVTDQLPQTKGKSLEFEYMWY